MGSLMAAEAVAKNVDQIRDYEANWPWLAKQMEDRHRLSLGDYQSRIVEAVESFVQADSEEEEYHSNEIQKGRDDHLAGLDLGLRRWSLDH